MLILRLIRDSWLISGLALAFFLLLESAYRGQASVRRVLRSPEVSAAGPYSAGHPNAGQAWWRELGAGERAPALRYDPFRGWWPRPSSSAYMNVDSLGRRVTIQPDAGVAAPRVLFLGGSVMWGWVVRDWATIPSQLAAITSADGIPIRAVNLAQSMFTLSQNVATLQLELRNGRVPNVVVFLDGNNEVATAYQSGRVGRVLNEDLLARRFERGRGSVAADLAALVGRSALVTRLQTARSAASLPRRETPDLCPEIAAQYRRLTLSVTALAREFGFRPLFIWQPLLATSRKPLAPWERAQDLSSKPGWREMLRRCAREVDTLMRPDSGRTYFALHDVFDGDSAAIFIDEYGHMTEAGHRRVAERLAPLVESQLSALRATRPQGAGR